MLREYQAIKPEGLWQLTEGDVDNLQGDERYYIEVDNPRPTTPVVTGQLSSTLTDGVILNVPRTDQFGLSFVAQPRGMGVLRFGNYELNFIPEPTLMQYDPDEDDITVLATLPIKESGASQFFISYDGEFISVGINDVSVPVPAPTEEEIEEIEILPGGGVVDMIAYWSRPVSDMEEQNMSARYHSIVNDENPLTIRMQSDEMMQSPATRVLHDVDYIDEDEAWTINFGPGTSVEVNQELVVSGELLDPAGDVVVNGEATANHYPTGVIETHPLAQVIVEALGGNDKTHPIYRAPDAGSRGSTTIIPREEEPNEEEGVDQIESISFWIDPVDGEIMDGVTMSEGILTGDVLVNGLAYYGDVLEDRFMITANRVVDEELVIHVPITNLHISPTQVNSRELYESYFVRPSLSVSAGSLSIEDNDIFIIDATWGIVTSG